MKAHNVSMAAMELALDRVNKDYAGNIRFKRLESKGRHIAFTLTVGGTRNGKKAILPGVRRGFQGQLVAAACWHAHYDFMEALFAACPQARIQSHAEDYKGSDDFQNRATFTGLQNIGSRVEPLAYRDACDCNA